MSRHLAIGDIHGCFKSLQTLLGFVKLRDDDILVPLGDYVDRGPDAKSVIEWLIRSCSERSVFPLRGNHEIMMLDSLENRLKMAMWVQVGGDAVLDCYNANTLDDIPEEHWEFLKTKLLPYHETESHIFVHAGAYAEIPTAEQPDFMLYWEQYSDSPRHESGKVIVCGHTSQRSGLPVTNGNAICIDTHAHGGGWLTCLHAESGCIWQANEQGETRKMWLDELPSGGEG